MINPITADGSLPVVDLAQRGASRSLATKASIAGAPLDGYITFDNLEVGRLQAAVHRRPVDPFDDRRHERRPGSAACIDFKTGAHWSSIRWSTRAT